MIPILALELCALVLTIRSFLLVRDKGNDNDTKRHESNTKRSHSSITWFRNRKGGMRLRDDDDGEVREMGGRGRVLELSAYVEAEREKESEKAGARTTKTTVRSTAVRGE